MYDRYRTPSLRRNHSTSSKRQISGWLRGCQAVQSCYSRPRWATTTYPLSTVPMVYLSRRRTSAIIWQFFCAARFRWLARLLALYIGFPVYACEGKPLQIANGEVTYCAMTATHSQSECALWSGSLRMSRRKICVSDRQEQGMPSNVPKWKISS